MRWDEAPLLAIDVETTGTRVDADRVVELGAAWFLGGRPLTLRRALVDPGCPIPPEATAIHHISDDDVLGAPRFGEAVERFLDHVSGVATGHADPVLCGYNALQFDLPILNAELARAGRAERLDPNRLVDPMVFVRWHHRGHPRRSLSAMCRHYGVPQKHAHAAADDSAAAGLLLYAMVDRGTVPPEVDVALAEQTRLRALLLEEKARWGHWLYADRDTGELHVGVGRHCGVPFRLVDADFVEFLLGDVDDLPSAVRAVAEARLRG